MVLDGVFWEVKIGKGKVGLWIFGYLESKDLGGWEVFEIVLGKRVCYGRKEV